MKAEDWRDIIAKRDEQIAMMHKKLQRQAQQLDELYTRNLTINKIVEERDGNLHVKTIIKTYTTPGGIVVHVAP